MKTKILKWLPMLAVFMVAIATTLISCTEDSSRPKGNVLPSCNPGTKHIHDVKDLEVLILNEENVPENYQEVYDIPILITTEGKAGLWEKGEILSNNYEICNYSQYVINWEIPKEGLKAVLSGKVYAYDKIHPNDAFYAYLELTGIRRKQL